MFGLEEKKESNFFMSDNEDKENVGLYSNMPVYDKENAPSQINKFNSIQSIPINSKQRIPDMTKMIPLTQA
jgi:tellurite resistance-related uncharacterized protein